MKYNIDYQNKAFNAESCHISAEEGYPPAQYNLGCCYFFGKGAEQDFEKAVYWYNQAVMQGNADAQYKLGLCYELGHGVDKDEDMAFILYEEAAKQDNIDAIYALERCYANGIGVKKNNINAGLWLEKANKLLNKENAHPYSSDEEDWEEYLFKEARGMDAADGNEDEGYVFDAELYHLAQCYETGLNREQDLIKAVDIYLYLAERGDKLGYMAGCKLREYCEDGILLDELIKKIDSGDPLVPDILDRLGNCYKYGFGVEKDLEKAVWLYRKAAGAGNVAAQRSLRYCYECGARAGDAMAQYNLAQLYFHGKGVKQNRVKAAYWYQKSASQDNVDAQRELALCYYYGRGVRTDLTEAIKWFTKAANQDDPVSQAALGSLYHRELGIKEDSV